MKNRLLQNIIRVGITDCSRYGNYERWFLDAPEQVEIIRLSHSLNNFDDLYQCQGVVLSGGEDVDPRRYKRIDLLGRVEFTDINEERDEFEYEVIRMALKLKLPILGICRGMQLFNVYHGGTLIFDIPTVTEIVGHAKINGIDQRHDIVVTEKTLLIEITGCDRGAVNSSHHQCVEKLGKNLKVAARAEEPIIEAVQWQNTTDHPFFLGVQWHPERMVDQMSPFSFNIRQAFLQFIDEHLIKPSRIENQRPDGHRV